MEKHPDDKDVKISPGGFRELKHRLEQNTIGPYKIEPGVITLFGVRIRSQ